MRQLLTILLVLFLIGCCGDNIINSPDVRTSDGPEIYYKDCLECHTPNDNGWGHVRREVKAKLSVEELYRLHNQGG